MFLDNIYLNFINFDSLRGFKGLLVKNFVILVNNMYRYGVCGVNAGDTGNDMAVNGFNMGACAYPPNDGTIPGNGTSFETSHGISIAKSYSVWGVYWSK